MWLKVNETLEAFIIKQTNITIFYSLISVP